MRFLVALVVAAGCGRLGFEPRIGDGDGGVDAAEDSAIDAANPACLVADGICVYGCAGIDSDCTSTCGDGICVGNGGELCVNCAADCRTLSPVCGNGACDAGEAAAGCIADCGPPSWPWVAEESELLSKVNLVRVAGYACPNGARPPAPALTNLPFLADAREWVWELAHQEFFMMGGEVCNGRTFDQRSNNNYNGALDSSGSYANVDAMLAKWLSNAGQCDALLEPMFTQGVTAVAHDERNAYVLLLKQ